MHLHRERWEEEKKRIELKANESLLRRRLFLSPDADFFSDELDETFKGATSEGDPHFQDIKSAFGFGIRANLGIFVLRYDLAWRTDFATVSHHPKYAFSLGAEF